MNHHQDYPGAQVQVPSVSWADSEIWNHVHYWNEMRTCGIAHHYLWNWNQLLQFHWNLTSLWAWEQLVLSHNQEGKKTVCSWHLRLCMPPCERGVALWYSPVRAQYGSVQSQCGWRQLRRRTWRHGLLLLNLSLLFCVCVRMCKMCAGCGYVHVDCGNENLLPYQFLGHLTTLQWIVFSIIPPTLCPRPPFPTFLLLLPTTFFSSLPISPPLCPFPLLPSPSPHPPFPLTPNQVYPLSIHGRTHPCLPDAVSSCSIHQPHIPQSLEKRSSGWARDEV